MSLHRDELELISRKLTFSPDYTRFRSVCKLWRSAAPKRPHLPWLIARDESDYDTGTGLFSEVDCIGSSHGWMALFNRSTSSISLFNPLTDYFIDLPILQNWRDDTSGWNTDSSNIKFYLTSDPGESLSDCFALIHVNSLLRILYCNGFSDWMEVLHPELVSIDIHICCYLGRTFIALYGDVFVCDFDCNPIVKKIVSFCDYDIAIEIKDSYLVESDGDLLLVLNYYFDYNDEDENFGYRVFKLEFEGEQAKLVLLKSLGDKALFLSPQTTFSLTASKYPGCKDNSIYSSYSVVDDDDGQCIQKLSIYEYDFEKGSSVVTNDDDVPLYVHWEHCGWFTPSLLE